MRAGEAARAEQDSNHHPRDGGQKQEGEAFPVHARSPTPGGAPRALTATQVRCDDTGVTHSSAAKKRSVWVILTNFFDAA
jgi:hypothetical protein